MNCDSNFCHNQVLILSDIKILHANQVFTFPRKIIRTVTKILLAVIVLKYFTVTQQ